MSLDKHRFKINEKSIMTFPITKSYGFEVICQKCGLRVDVESKSKKSYRISSFWKDISCNEWLIAKIQNS